MDTKIAEEQQHRHINLKEGWGREVKRLFLIVMASIIIAINMKTFISMGGLVPGGFNGTTLLIQRIGLTFFDVAIPFTLINLLLNAFPAILSFFKIGKRFTLYSGLMIVLTSIFTDLIPAQVLTYDILLISIFGGIINGFAISLCLRAEATSGGTDFIAIFFSERGYANVWNYILFGNAGMLLISGWLFGWDSALYSIIFQFASTQVVNMLHQRYRQKTLFIITDHPEEVYAVIEACTHHGATAFEGTGLYRHESRSLVYSVVSSDEIKEVLKRVREVDPGAFVNIVKTERLMGRFYQRPTD